MSSEQLRVDGGRRLRSTLRKAGADLGDLKDSHRRVAGIVGIAAKFGAPRGQTGKLAASVRPSGTQSAAIVRAGFASVPYAAPIHWGWPKRNIKAQPWISEAAQDTEPEWFDVYHTELVRILDQVEGITNP